MDDDRLPPPGEWGPPGAPPPAPPPLPPPGWVLGSEPGGGVTRSTSSFWQRVAAVLVDGAILLVPNLVLAQSTEGSFVSILLALAYSVIGDGVYGATVGKRALGLRVVGRDGEVIGPGRAFIRYLGKIVSGVVFGLGYLWMLWDPQRQTWHDKMAGSFVLGR